MFARKPFTTTLLLSLFFSFCLTACDDTKNTSIGGPRAEKVTHRVEVVIAEKKPVFLTQTVSGTLEAVTKIRLYNEESGRITKMPYHEGDFVKKGDLLIQLDNELLKTDVDKARASKEQAKVDLSRLKKLLTKKIATEEEVANARTVLDLAIAEEKRQLTRLRRTSIKAPIDGLITRRLYEPGDLLAQQSHIQTIIDPTKIRLKASLAERWIPLVEDGQEVALHIDALGDKTFTAHVERVHPTISLGTHKGIVEILLDPVPDNAKVGQFVRAEIKLKASNRLVIPVHAIHYEPEGAYVYRVIKNENSESTAEKVFFEQGQQFGALSEALTEIKINDKIVTRGHLGLRDGKKVEIANPDQLSGTTAE
jgi:RND family efflux transporter MFP subunit